jgi:hypothetical protein
MDSGRQRVRRRGVNEQQELSLTWNFSDLQFMLFKVYFRDTLKSGTQWFTIDLANGEGEEILTTTRVRFTSGAYQFQYQPHMRWTVQAQVLKDIVTVEDMSHLFDLFAYSGGDMTGLVLNLDSLHTLVHTTIPDSI